jgi:thiol-disulfide isomerase/thioredoxin
MQSSSARAGLLAAVLLVASAAGGFVLYRLTVPVRPTLYAEPASLRAANAGSTPAPAAGQEPHAPAIPEELPKIALPDLDGKVRALSDWSGRPLLINFWATWCEPCRREVPLLRALKRKQTGLGLEVVGIAIDSPDAVRQYVASHGIDYPVLIGEKDGFAAITAFGMDTGLPFSVFSDRSGRVVTLKVGELHADEADLILDRLQRLDAGGLTLAAARAQITDGVRLLGLQRAAEGVPETPSGSASGSPSGS